MITKILLPFCVGLAFMSEAGAAPNYFSADTRNFFVSSSNLGQATIKRPSSATGVFKTLVDCQNAAVRELTVFQAEAAVFGATNAGSDISCSPVAAVDTGVPGSYLMVDQWNTGKANYTYSRTAPVLDLATCRFKNLSSSGRAVWLFSDSTLIDAPGDNQISSTPNYLSYSVPQADGSSDIVFIGCT